MLDVEASRHPSTGLAIVIRVGNRMRFFHLSEYRWVRLGIAQAAALAVFASILPICASSAPYSETGVRFGAWSPSVLEVPLEIDIGPIFQKAEALLPTQAGHWRSWQKERGIETRYRAWRGPLAVSLQGDLLTVQAHVRYWVQARKRVLGSFDLKVGCGVDEPPRQAVVGVLVRLAWAPDWTLRPGFRVMPTRFIDECEVTAADIDISPIIDKVFRSRMEDSLRAALSELRPRLDDARRRAAGYWQKLQRPAEIAPGVWLAANPLAVALAPPYGSGRRLQTVLGLALTPRLEVGGPSAPEIRPLPPLQTFVPRGAGMRFDLRFSVDLERLARHLSSILAGRNLGLEGRSLGIRRIELRGEGGRIVVNAALSGDASGRVEVWATPVFDAESQSLELTDLDFVYDPDDPDLALMANLFYQRIQSALEDGANDLLSQHAGRLRQGLKAALADPLPEGLELDLAPLRLRDLDIEIDTDAILLRGSASGNVVLTAR